MVSSLRIHRGRFIVIEGPDLSGKSTFSHRIEEAIRVLGLSTLWTTEPWRDHPDGEAIYKFLMDETAFPTTPLRLQERFRINRAEHVEHIINPALSVGTTIVCDRYVPSSIVYGKADGVDEGVLWEMNASFPLPDLVFVLQVGDIEARRRATERGQNGRLSKWDQDPEFQERVRTHYWDLWRNKASRICLDPHNVILLNGEESREEIQRQAAEHLLGLTASR